MSLPYIGNRERRSRATGGNSATENSTKRVRSQAGAPDFFQFSRLLQLCNHPLSTVLNQRLVVGAECRRKMAIDIEFADDLLLHKDRHHDFGLGFQGTSEIARIFCE